MKNTCTCLISSSAGGRGSSGTSLNENRKVHTETLNIRGLLCNIGNYSENQSAVPHINGSSVMIKCVRTAR